MTDSLRELLPCPFCGETACGTVGSVVGCASCDIWMTSKAWNRRALLAETPGEAGLFTAEQVLALMKKAIEDHPSGENDSAEMGRYVWPERWDALRSALAVSPPSDQGLRDVAQRLLSAIDRAMVEDDDLPDGIDGTLIDDLREVLASKKGGTP
jgi:hypothetical protein